MWVNLIHLTRCLPCSWLSNVANSPRNLLYLWSFAPRSTNSNICHGVSKRSTKSHTGDKRAPFLEAQSPSFFLPRSNSERATELTSLVARFARELRAPLPTALYPECVNTWTLRTLVTRCWWPLRVSQRSVKFSKSSSHTDRPDSFSNWKWEKPSRGKVGNIPRETTTCKQLTKERPYIFGRFHHPRRRSTSSSSQSHPNSERCEQTFKLRVMLLFRHRLRGWVRCAGSWPHRITVQTALTYTPVVSRCSSSHNRLDCYSLTEHGSYIKNILNIQKILLKIL